MQYVPNQSANAALAVAVNILDTLVEKGVLSNKERIAVLDNAISDLSANTVSNNDSRDALKEIMRARYR